MEESLQAKIDIVKNRDEGIFELLNQERRIAYQKGKEEGEKIGYHKAKEEMEAVFHLLQTIVDKLLEQKKRLFEEIKPEVIEFALTICEKMIRSELSYPEKLTHLINAYLDPTSSTFEGECIKIALSPEDMVTLQSRLGNLYYDKKVIGSIRLISDSKIKRGDFRIESKTSLLNFNLTRELEDLTSKVLKQ